MNRNDLKINILAGFGRSGCSAVVDLLKEVDSFYVFPQEFRLFNDPDGLISLESALLDNWSVFQTNVAVTRFKKLARALNTKYRSPYPGLGYSKYFGKDFLEIVQEYIDKLVEVSFMGLSYGIDDLLRRQLGYRIRFLRRSSLVCKKMYIAKNLSEEEFLRYTRDFVAALANHCLEKYDKRIFTFDEGFVSMSAYKVLRYLPASGKIVTVIRDPRDVYAEGKLTGDAWLFLPKEVSKFAKYHIAMFTRWEEQKKKILSEKLIQVKFEDIVLDYENTVNRIFEFLNIDPVLHKDRKKYLNPDVSKKNAGLWKKFLTEEEKSEMAELLEYWLEKYGW